MSNPHKIDSYDTMIPSAKAYWDRPFLVRFQDSYCSVSQCFETEREAVRYIADQSARVARGNHWDHRGRLTRWSMTAELSGPFGSRKWNLGDVLDVR